MKFNQQAFNNFILDNNVIGFFENPITLKSGRKSNWYVNWRNILEDVFLSDKLTDFVISFTKEKRLNPDCFYGVPEGATKLAILTQYKWAKQSENYAQGSHVLAMGRGQQKEHGIAKDEYFLGMPKGKTIILEDVTTTGSSLITTIDNLTEAEIPIVAAFGLTNRNELRDDRYSVEDAVLKKGVKYHALSHAYALLPKAYRKLKPKKDIAKSVEEEFEKYGISPIILEP